MHSVPPPSQGSFLRAVFRHWITLVGGCAVIVLLGIGERTTGKNIPRSIYLLMLALLFCVACYLAWRDERRMRGEEFSLYQSEKAKQNEILQKLENQEDRQARRKWLREQLGKLLKEGDQIRWGVMSQKAGAHREHTQWIIRVNEFLSQEPEFDLSHRARFDATQLAAISEFIKEFN
ncbi:MAG TPA: hypothetical protein VMS31_22140 [Pyrinomonadaceae bacterium]|nr:hypothetical protein [Pyrinomonadaceae bacterium]